MTEAEPTEAKPTVAEIIARNIAEKGWSIPKAAREVGIHRTAMWFLVNDIRNPSNATAKKLAAVFGGNPVDYIPSLRG